MKFCSVTYVVGPLFHSLKVALFVFVCPTTFFVLSDKNIDLGGHMSFQKEKNYLQPRNGIMGQGDSQMLALHSSVENVLPVYD